MQKTIQIAKVTLADMFDIDVNNFEVHVTRKIAVVEARRFLIYFLVRELGIKFLHIKKYMPALTNHASAIHHFNKLDELMTIYPLIKAKYKKFKETMMVQGLEKLEIELNKQMNLKRTIEINIHTLKTLINES